MTPALALRIALGVVLSGGIAVLVVLNRAWLLDALSLARGAQPAWLAAALLVILLSYLVSGQVLRVALAQMGQQISVLRAWMTALVAIIISQSIPAGGVGTYAFLANQFRRRGATAEQSALVAGLEALSYASAMVLVALFSALYLALHGSAGKSFLEPLLAALGSLGALGLGVSLVTRHSAALERWLVAVNRGLALVWAPARRSDWPRQAAAQIARGRELLIANWRLLAGLVGIQLAGLCGHSLAMLLILRALGVSVSYEVVLAAFGAALVTSLLNVLPGGGGTIETILAAVLGFLEVGPAAVPAAVIFRLLNFWLLLPLAGLAYAWLTREPRAAPE